MVTVDEFSRLVSGIYAAALSPWHWKRAIREIHRSMGGTGGSLLVAEGAIWTIVNSTISERARESYARHYCHLDHVLACVGKGPVGAVRTGTELIRPNRSSEFYTGWLRPNGVEDGLFVKLSDEPRPACFLVTSADSSSPFGTPERVKLMTGLVPHLQQALGTQDKLALRTQDKLALLSHASADRAPALDVVRHGILIVGPGRSIRTLNAAAERILGAGEGLTIQSGCIRATNTSADRQLHLAVQSALTDGGSKTRSGRSFTCERLSGKRPYVIEVLPLQHAGPGELSRAVVVIIDPDREPDPAAALRRVHGLTNSEAEVALRLMRGANLKQISDELSVSLTTVRTHLQHLFDKTDTHRQAELVRHLLTRHEISTISTKGLSLSSRPKNPQRPSSRSFTDG